MVLLRFFDRQVRKLFTKSHQDDDDDDISILIMEAHELSDNPGADFILDNKSENPMMIALNRPKTQESRAKAKLLFEDDGSNVLPPSIMAREHGQILGHRVDTVTTSDFLLPNNLLTSSKDKIYGFYYVT